MGTGIEAFPCSELNLFVLAIYHDGKLTAAVHATKRGAMEAAVDYLTDEGDGEDGDLEAQFARTQRIIAADGGILEIVASPIFGK